MKISKKQAEMVLARAMSTGADYAEIFAEYTTNRSIQMLSGKVEEIADALISGASVRVFKGLRSVCGSTTDLSEAGLLACAGKVADVLGQSNASVQIHLTERTFGDIHPVRIVPGSVANREKVELLRRGCESAKAYHSTISQISGTILDVDHQIQIATSEGLLAEDRQIRTRMAIQAIASDGTENQTGAASPGTRMGLEMFERFQPEALGREAAAQAVTMLSAAYCPAGKMPVVIGNGFGGVIFHEACGHSLEASCVALGQSQFAGKLGQQIATTKVTAIDDGTIPNAWGSINIDDEGTPAQRNVLIEKGVLKTYMIDKFNGRRMGMASTGSCRRQSYLYEPTSRMTNTYIADGEDSNDDIIASVEYGLYAKAMGGGQVNPVTGEFNFGVREGYLIRNGKIAEPVRGAMLVGKGSEILMNIDMVGTSMDMAAGMCGASSGSIPTNVGQPMIHVSSITVGGR